MCDVALANGTVAQSRGAVRVGPLLYLPLLALLVPALGRPYGKLGYYLHVAVILTLVVGFLLLRAKRLSVPRDIATVFMAPVVVLLFSMLYGSVVVHGRLVPSDIIEILRPLYYFLTILVGIEIGRALAGDGEHREEAIHRFLLVALLSITAYNFAFSVLPFLRIEPFYSLSEYFGEDETFHKAYAAFRAYGITGQPGTQAILTNVLIVGLLFLLDSGRRRMLCSLALLMNVAVLLVTFSRVGLLMLALILGLHLLLTRSRALLIALAAGGAIGVGLVMAYWETLVPYTLLMLRGLDLAEGDLGTLEYRLRFKAQILSAISGRFDTVLFGYGPAKAYLEALPGNLRNPDSSYSVYLVRYGVLGAVLYLLPYLYLLGYALLSRPQSEFLRRYRSMLLVLLAFIFTVANLDPPFEQWKIVLIMNVLLGIYVALGVPARSPTSGAAVESSSRT
jgi:hypothetical protein